MRSFRILCALLVMVLMLPGGMTLAEQPRVAMGRYVEVPLNTGGDWAAFAQVKDTIYGVNASGDTLLKSLSMKNSNWDELETGYDDKDAAYPDGVNGLAVGKDGTLYLSSGWAMTDEKGYPHIERIKNGKSKRVQLDQKLDTGSDSLTICALPSGDLIGLSDPEIYRFSKDGITKQKYVVPGATSMAVHGSEMAVYAPRDGLISILDIESGQTQRTLEPPAKASYGLVSFDSTGALYFACPEGIFRVNAGGTLFEQIVNGKLCTLGKPSAYARALMFDPENNPIIAYSQGGSMSLIAYRYDENVATEPGTMLSVFTLYDSAAMRECANRFQLKYPDVMVDIIVALPEGTAITRDDAIRTLNTEVLAGKGPDVVVLDGLPIESYLEKGVLQDLSPVVQPMMDSGELQASLAGAFAKSGAIPAVPTRFLLPSIWGDVAGMNTLSDMANWAQTNPESSPFFAADVETLISTFYSSSAPAWFDANGHLDEAQIEAFLTAAKTIRGGWSYEAAVQKLGYDYKAMIRDEGYRIPEWNPYINGMWHGMDEGFGADMLMMGMQRQLPHLLRGVNDTADVNGKVKVGKLRESGFAALPGQAQGCFLPKLTLGASKGSANGETALKFIGFALGGEAQIVDMGEGFPVSAKALDAMQADNDEDGSHSNWGGGSATIGSWFATWLNQTERDQLRGIIDELKTPVIVDFTLYQMIVRESTPFFDGTIDAKQAAANVCAKANAYLSE